MRAPRFIIIVLLIVGGSGGIGDGSQESNAVNAIVGARNDHHIHLLSPELVRDWKSLGVPFSRPDSFYSSVSSALNEAGIEAAVVLSMAYLYGSERFQRLDSDVEKEYDRVRHENDFIASVVRRSPKKVAGFGSVHPMRPYALGEIRRCWDELGLAGLKLHLLNSEVDLADKGHVDRLAEIFGWAQEKGVPLMLHLNAVGGSHPAKNVEILVRDLINKHPKVEIYIAHLGGSGGYGAQVQEVLKAFIANLNDGGMLKGSRIFFEISAVVLRESSEGVEPPNEERLTQLASDLRGLGLHRVLFGSDHPVFNSQAYARTLREKSFLRQEEVRRILTNEAPVLRRLRSR